MSENEERMEPEERYETFLLDDSDYVQHAAEQGHAESIDLLRKSGTSFLMTYDPNAETHPIEYRLVTLDNISREQLQSFLYTAYITLGQLIVDIQEAWAKQDIENAEDD